MRDELSWAEEDAAEDETLEETAGAAVEDAATDELDAGLELRDRAVLLNELLGPADELAAAPAVELAELEIVTEPEPVLLELPVELVALTVTGGGMIGAAAMAI